MLALSSGFGPLDVKAEASVLLSLQVVFWKQKLENQTSSINSTGKLLAQEVHEVPAM